MDSKPDNDPEGQFVSICWVRPVMIPAPRQGFWGKVKDLIAPKYKQIGGGFYAAIREDGTILVSTDAANWTLREVKEGSQPP